MSCSKLNLDFVELIVNYFKLFQLIPSYLMFSYLHELLIIINTLFLDNFCKYRCNGKFQDPWNCRDFFTCFQGRTTTFPCAPPPVILAYDGDIFQCADIACQQLPTAGKFCKISGPNKVIQSLNELF